MFLFVADCHGRCFGLIAGLFACLMPYQNSILAAVPIAGSCVVGDCLP